MTSHKVDMNMFSTPKNTNKITAPPQTPQKDQQKAIENRLRIRTLTLPNSTIKQIDMDSRSDSDSSTYSSQRYKMHYRSRSRSPYRKVNRYRKKYIVRVPTSDLAEIAIKEAFREGIYDLQILIED